MDLERFHQTFFEESFEGLERMETELLALEAAGEGAGAVDPETINTIFRAAHSIKGGAGTFGFKEVADFTHHVETLLDEMRAGRRPVTAEAVGLLLRCVDCLREMLASQQAGERPDTAQAESLRQALEALRGNAAQEAPSAVAPQAEAPAGGWRIRFRPLPHLLQTGNDPVRMFRALAELGELTVRCDEAALPAFGELDPEVCYLAWELELRGQVPRREVEEVFEWVEGDCELAIEPLGGRGEAAPETDAAPAGDATEAPALGQPRERTQSAPAGVSAQRRPRAQAGSIRVSIDKIDALINTVGELVITQSILGQIGRELEGVLGPQLEKLRNGLAQLERNTRELQEGIMGIRMLPISFAFSRFPRLVHDLGRQLGKQVRLEISGEQTELDKTVMEHIGDPLVHLVRNALDHGIEPPEEREAAGKDPVGTLRLSACHRGGNILIEVRDDGRGLDRERILAKARERGLVAPDAQLSDAEVYDLIFQPGFSTAAEVTDVSGRGVGMDVVRKNIREVGGTVEVASEPGRGSAFTIRLPLTLAIVDGQLVRVGSQIYVIPLVSIVESLQMQAGQVNVVAGRGEVYKLRDQYLPVVRLYEQFGIEAEHTELAGGMLVVVEGEGRRFGLLVDELLGQQQVVIKSLEANFRRVEGVSGATILGDGTVALILDVGGLHPAARQQAAA